MNADTPVTRAELKSELAAAEKRIVDRIVEYVDERTRDLQTELLRAFVDYSNSADFALESHR